MAVFGTGGRALVQLAQFETAVLEGTKPGLVLRHVSYGYDFVHDSACLNTATELMFPEPRYDCEAFYRDLERQRVLGVAAADRWAASVPASSGNVVRREPLLCWWSTETARFRWKA